MYKDWVKDSLLIGFDQMRYVIVQNGSESDDESHGKRFLYNKVNVAEEKKTHTHTKVHAFFCC